MKEEVHAWGVTSTSCPCAEHHVLCLVISRFASFLVSVSSCIGTRPADSSAPGLTRKHNTTGRVLAVLKGRLQVLRLTFDVFSADSLLDLKSEGSIDTFGGNAVFVALSDHLIGPNRMLKCD